MKLITNSSILEREFLRLLNDYSNYYWLTAWASSKSNSFTKLLANQERIEKIVVGIHFYQTHPDFIEAFLDSDNVRYIKQPNGIFHPKLYLFYNNDHDWEAITGSANFTKSAFTLNTEISSLISSNESNSKEVLDQIFELINSCWSDSKKFDHEELAMYRNTWRNLKPKRESLSGNYGTEKKSQLKKIKPIHQVPISNMSWQDFMTQVANDPYHSLTARLKVLGIAHSLFQKTESFKDLANDERKFIAGIPNRLPVDKDVDWGFFGSMKGAGIYNNRIIENDENISNALDEIPLSGQITKNHYNRYLNCFTKVFTGNYVGTASRLLAMKRPDVFICLDSKNKISLCRDFGIVQSGIDYERYWNDIIERIYDSNWWQNPQPKNSIESKVSNARAAFLDSLYYIQ